MMRSHRPIVAAVACLLAGSAYAQTTLYWDTNGTTAGASAGTTAAGTWDSTTANWSTNSAGTNTTQLWTSGQTAVFSAGTNATDAYVVTVEGTQSANIVQFQRGNVTLQGGTLNVPEMSVASGLTATVSSSLTSLAVPFVKAGAGTLDLTGSTQADQGIAVNSGTLAITGAGASLYRAFSQDLDINLNASTNFIVSDGATIYGYGLTLRSSNPNGNGTFTVASGGTLLVGSSVSGGGALTEAIVFNNFTGAPILAGGTLQAYTFGLKTSAPFALAAGTTSFFDTNGTSLILTGVISGDGALNKIGDGTYTAYGNNTYTGGTTLTAGTLALGNLNALGTGPLIFAGGTLHVEGLSPTFGDFPIASGALTVAGAGTVFTSTASIEAGNSAMGAINVTRGGKVISTTSTAAGLVSGAIGTINVDGSGSTLQVGTDFFAGYSGTGSGALNLTNSGGATIGGSASFGDGDGSVGSASIASGATLTVAGDTYVGRSGTGTLSVSGAGSLTSSANAFLGYDATGSGTATVTDTDSAWHIAGYLEAGHAGTGTLTVSDGGVVSTTTSTAAGVVAGSTGVINVTGTGAALNVGTTLVGGYDGSGTISVGDGGVITADTVLLASGAGSSGTLDVDAGGTLLLGGLTQGSGTATVNLAGGTLAALSRSFATSVPLTLAAGTTSSLAVSGVAVTFSGPISGSGALTNDGAGIVALSAHNTFSGGFAMNAGSLLLGDAGGLGTGPVALNGGNIDFGGFAPTISKLIFSGGTFTNGSLANTAAFEIHSGTVGYTLSGSGSLTKTTAGTATLTGDNSYTGGTTLNAGTLTLGHVNALGTGPLTFAGGNLLVQGFSPTYTPFVIQDGGATVTGSGTVLSSATYAEVGNGGTGVLDISNAAEVSAASSAVAGLGASGQGTINVDGAGSLLNVGTFFAAGYHAGTTGTLALTHSGSATVGQYAIIGYNGTGSLSVGSGASFTTTQDLDLGLAATGAGTLAISGAGTVTTGANAYIGYAGGSSATIGDSGSTWNIAGVLYTGFGASGALTIGSGGVVAADYVDLARNAGSAGTIDVNSGGTLRLGGLTQGAGTAALTLGGGTLEIMNRSFATSVPLALADGTTSTISVSGLAVQFDGTISGGGALAKSGVGILTLDAANTYTGGTVVNAGTLTLAHDSALGTGSLTMNGGALGIAGGNRTFANALVIDAATSLDTGLLTWTQNGVVSGAGAWSKAGAGNLILAAANTHSGAVDLTAGTITLGHASGLGTSTTTVRAGTVLDLGNFTATSGSVFLDGGTLQNGTFAGASFAASAGTVSAVLGGSGGLAKTGAGTLTLSAINPYTGATTVDGGSLLLDGTAAQITQTSGLTVGDTAAGTLSITNDARVVTSGQAKFGNTTGNPGTVAVSGAGSLLQVGGYLEVGRGGADTGSTLAVTAGGHVAVAQSTALAVGAGGNSTLTIDGPDSLLSSGTSLYLGHSGTGTVNITDGGRLTAGSFIDVGSAAGSNGQVTVSGAQSELATNSYLQVGAGGTGNLHVLAGGNVSAGSTVAIGVLASSDGAVSVSGSGSQLTVGTALYNGYLSAGTLSIGDGGVVSIGQFADLGVLAGGSGTLNLDAGGTLRVGGTDGVRQGAAGTAAFNLAGGTLQVTGSALTTTVPATLTNTSTIDTNKLGATFTGALSGTGGLAKTGAGTLTLNGTHTYTGDTAISAGQLTLNGSAASSAFTVSGTGTLGGNATVGALTVGAGGTLAPGNSPGTITAGNTTFAGGGTFQLQLNDATGSAGTNWDQLAVDGTLTLSATSANPFTLDLTSLTAGDVGGDAANFNASADYSFTFLTTTGGVSGFSSDKFAIDTTHFTNPFTGTWSVSLTNSGRDLSVNYAGASAVPEPSTYAALAGLTALAAGLVLRRRPRHSKGY
jgi:T5SS/PEP-CTERM-associated repeat protein/autotransporter-associated beta strand protein